MIHQEHQKKTIGILGGMGPSASADFYRALVDIAQREYNAEQDTDFPAMHLYNLPLSGFDETGFADPDTVCTQLVRAAKILEGAGSDFIVMACNTVHAFYEDMLRAIHIPIVSIIDEVVARTQRDGFASVCLLTSESTRNYQLYEKAFARQGIKAVVASDNEQKTLNRIIHRVMGGLQGAEDVELLRSIVKRHEHEGAEAIVLGCTELPLSIKQEDIHLPLLSSTDILAHAALARAYGTAST